MAQMLVDGIKSITVHGNVVRIQCVSVGADGKEEVAGTLVIPGNEVGPIVQSLVNGLQEMQKQMRDRAAAAGAEPGTKSN